MTSQNNPLDAVFEQQGQLPANDILHQALLANTVGVIRRRRRMKRCARAGVLLGCYLAGAATMLLLYHGTQNTQQPIIQTQIATNNTPKSGVTKPLPSDFVGPPDQKAVYPVASKYEVLCREADRYLRDPETLQLAVRTYSRALKYASAEQRAISPGNDSWMLMALKDAHTKETKHESKL